ncbi:acyl-CoA thioesterase [Oleisolibacter albus]|uniref:acyl-CoA thioesterase n=1 Tax=Oleisolibacter albus TaxID=2171757 RepID=UPI00138FB8F4|nr:thioesterase family protein [Oleisolibacter albus]
MDEPKDTMIDHLDFIGTLAAMQQQDGRFTVPIAANWSQGRAGFGGLVAAVGLQALRRSLGETAPLRSLAVIFAGPAVGTLDIGVQVLRRGRTASFAQALLTGGGGVAATVTACFGADRPSVLTLAAPTAPPVPPPEATPELVPVPGVTPAFIGNFELRHVSPDTLFAGGDQGELLCWVRHRDPAAWTGEAAFLALLDVLPPAAAMLLPRPTPVSSLTWMIDFPGSALETRDGWWLVRSRADYAGSGFSGQAMAAWNRDGAAVAFHRQGVGVFG